MSERDKKKRRYKKNQHESNREPSPKEPKQETKNSSLPVEEAKELLGLDLASMSSATQLKYKFYTDTLIQLLQYKNDKVSKDTLYNLYLSTNEKKINLQTQTIRNKYEILSLDKDIASAKAFYDSRYKKLLDKDKLQRMIVDKADKINKEKAEIVNSANEYRTKIIKEAESYVRDLQAKQTEEMPERERLVAINNNYRKEIENCLKEGLAMKECFDKQVKESTEKMKVLNGEGNQEELKAKMEDISANAQKKVLEATDLKSELLSYEKKIAELEELRRAVVRQEEKFRKDVEEKRTEAILLGSENEEIRMRIQMGGVDQKELAELMKVYEAGSKKIKVMLSLNRKYGVQYDKLYRELHPNDEQNPEEGEQNQENAEEQNHQYNVFDAIGGVENIKGFKELQENIKKLQSMGDVQGIQNLQQSLQAGLKEITETFRNSLSLAGIGSKPSTQSYQEPVQQEQQQEQQQQQPLPQLPSSSPLQVSTSGVNRTKGQNSFSITRSGINRMKGGSKPTAEKASELQITSASSQNKSSGNQPQSSTGFSIQSSGGIEVPPKSES